MAGKPLAPRGGGMWVVTTNEQFARFRKPEPALITEAEWSLADQHAARKRRYAITMGIRTVCLVLAAVFYHVVWLMLLLAILGTVLPWVAVIMANDRPAKKKLIHHGHVARPDRVLESRTPKVIDE